MTAENATSNRRVRLAPDERREQLIRTAVAVYAREGITNSSVLQITRTAGVSNGTFYRYYKTKQHLDDDVADLVITEMTAELTDFQSPLGYPDRVAAGACWVMRSVGAQPSLGSIMADYFERRDAVIRHHAVELEGDIRAGLTRGQFHCDDVPLTIRLFVVMFGVGAREVLARGEPKAVGELIAAAQLRMLGVPWAHSSRIASRVNEMVARDHPGGASGSHSHAP